MKQFHFAIVGAIFIALSVGFPQVSLALEFDKFGKGYDKNGKKDDVCDIEDFRGATWGGPARFKGEDSESTTVLNARRPNAGTALAGSYYACVTVCNESGNGAQVAVNFPVQAPPNVMDGQTITSCNVINSDGTPAISLQCVDGGCKGIWRLDGGLLFGPSAPTGS